MVAVGKTRVAGQLHESDRYCTDPSLLAIVAEMWPEGIETDPCWDPACFVEPKVTKYDIREGRDGLVLPWHGRVWLQPPYSRPAPWMARAASHALQGGEVLGLVNAAVDTDAWRDYVWPYATAVCFLSRRQRFYKAGARMPSPHPAPSAIVYWGDDLAAFWRVWRAHGQVVRTYSGTDIESLADDLADDLAA